MTPGGSAAASRLLVDETGRATTLYAAYLRYQAKYDRAVAQRDDAYLAARRDARRLRAWPIEGRRYEEAVEHARQQWLVLGSKDEVERLLAVPLDSSGLGHPEPRSEKDPRAVVDDPGCTP